MCAKTEATSLSRNFVFGTNLALASSACLFFAGCSEPEDPEPEKQAATAKVLLLQKCGRVKPADLGLLPQTKLALTAKKQGIDSHISPTASKRSNPYFFKFKKNDAFCYMGSIKDEIVQHSAAREYVYRHTYTAEPAAIKRPRDIFIGIREKEELTSRLRFPDIGNHTEGNFSFCLDRNERLHLAVADVTFDSNQKLVLWWTRGNLEDGKWISADWLEVPDAVCLWCEPRLVELGNGMILFSNRCLERPKNITTCELSITSWDPVAGYTSSATLESSDEIEILATTKSPEFVSILYRSRGEIAVAVVGRKCWAKSVIASAKRGDTNKYQAELSFEKGDLHAITWEDGLLHSRAVVTNGLAEIHR